MTHVGFDGIGYRTGLASSDDLVSWKNEGLMIDRGRKGSVTEFNVALTWILRDNELFGSGDLKKVDGRYLGTYHAYPGAGYECGPAAIGLCWSDDLRHWELDEPFMRNTDPDSGDWEKGGLYKSCVVEHQGTFFMFYNAKNVTEGPWTEQIGVVMSDDLRTWTRCEESPVLKVGHSGPFDDVFASEPFVVRCGDIWVMFYFGLSSDGHARDGVAFSRDLLHWEKSGETLIDVGPSGSIDSIYAHKQAMFHRDGKLYHFYCAVAPVGGNAGDNTSVSEVRGIGLATS
jgi:predicted GH43/DUF377 family glycosyl hydrolase